MKSNLTMKYQELPNGKKRKQVTYGKTADGKPMRKSIVRDTELELIIAVEEFKRLKKHGLKMTFHDLRAQFATTMNGLGVEKEVVEKLGGWANSKVLDAVYIRTPKQRVRDSLKIFDEYMYGVIRDTRTEKSDGAA